MPAGERYFQTSRNVLLRETPIGPDAARRQPAPLSHPFHINHAFPSQLTQTTQTAQHNRTKGKHGQWRGAEETSREERQKHVRHREEGTKPSERSEHNLQRDKDKHDHTGETGLAKVTRRNRRALAATPQRPASCTPNRGPCVGVHVQTKSSAGPRLPWRPRAATSKLEKKHLVQINENA